MIPFLRLAVLARNAKSSFAGGSYLDAIGYAIQMLALLGFDSEAQKIAAMIKDIQNGDARAIAVDALGLVADVFGLVFQSVAPIAVGASAPATIESRFETIACQCDKLAAPTTGAISEATADTKAIDPQTVLVIVQIAQQLFTFLWDRYNKKPTPAPAA